MRTVIVGANDFAIRADAVILQRHVFSEQLDMLVLPTYYEMTVQRAGQWMFTDAGGDGFTEDGPHADHVVASARRVGATLLTVAEEEIRSTPRHYAVSNLRHAERIVIARDETPFGLFEAVKTADWLRRLNPHAEYSFAETTGGLIMIAPQPMDLVPIDAVRDRVRALLADAHVESGFYRGFRNTGACALISDASDWLLFSEIQALFALRKLEGSRRAFRRPKPPLRTWFRVGLQDSLRDEPDHYLTSNYTRNAAHFRHRAVVAGLLNANDTWGERGLRLTDKGRDFLGDRIPRLEDRSYFRRLAGWREAGLEASRAEIDAYIGKALEAQTAYEAEGPRRMSPTPVGSIRSRIRSAWSGARASVRRGAANGQ